MSVVMPYRTDPLHARARRYRRVNLGAVGGVRDLCKAGLMALVLTLGVAAPVAANPLDDGVDAEKRGDYAAALALWRPLAEQGNAAAQFDVGSLYANGYGVVQDYVEAASWYRKAADQGYASAQSSLGFMYYAGRGAPQDFDQAATWFQKAADQGNASGEFYLGDMYAAGQSVPQDDAQAAAWYAKAADQGHPAAQFNLAILYSRGRGVAQDPVQALKWYSLAAASFPAADVEGRTRALNNRDKLAATMTPAQILEAQTLARDWKAK